MKTARSFCMLMTTLSTLLIGCSASEQVDPKDQSSSQIVDSLRSTLKLTAEYGEGGSALDTLRNDFELLKAADPAKAAAIDADMQSLLQAADAEQRKTLATQIVEKL